MNLSYIPLQEYRRKWIFNHNEIPVSDEDKSIIKPLTEQSAMLVWNTFISKKSIRPDLISKGDWAARSNSWKKEGLWQAAWDSEESALPEPILESIDWEDDTPIFFCYEKYQVIETTWAVFQRNWKCFLFFDDGPLLVSSAEKQAIWFQQNGEFQLGIRS